MGGEETSSATATIEAPRPSTEALAGVASVLKQIKESREDTGGQAASGTAGDGAAEGKPETTSTAGPSAKPEADAAADEKVPASEEPQSETESPAEDHRPEAGAAEAGAAKGGVDDALRKRAEALGLTEAAIDAIAPAQLPILLDRLEWKPAAGPAQEPAATRPAKVEARAAPSAAPEPAEEDQGGELPKYLSAIDAEVAEETLTKAVGGLYREMHGRIGKLEQVIVAERQAFDQQKARQFLDRHNKRIKALDPGWQELFGDEPFEQLDEGSPEREKQVELLREMFAIKTRMASATPDQQPDEDEQFRRALNGRFYEHAMRLTAEQTNREIDKHNDDALPRPTGRKPGITEAERKQQAIDRVKAAQAKHN